MGLASGDSYFKAGFLHLLSLRSYFILTHAGHRGKLFLSLGSGQSPVLFQKGQDVIGVVNKGFGTRKTWAQTPAQPFQAA